MGGEADQVGELREGIREGGGGGGRLDAVFALAVVVSTGSRDDDQI